MHGAHIQGTPTNEDSLLGSWRHRVHMCTHICNQPSPFPAPLTPTRFHTQKHTHIHTTRDTEGACCDEGIILLLTQPIPLKTNEESYTDTLQPSEGSNTQAPDSTHTHTHAWCKETPCYLCCHLCVCCFCVCFHIEGSTCEALLSHLICDSEHKTRGAQDERRGSGGCQWNSCRSERKQMMLVKVVHHILKASRQSLRAPQFLTFYKVWEIVVIFWH